MPTREREYNCTRVWTFPVLAKMIHGARAASSIKFRHARFPQSRIDSRPATDVLVAGQGHGKDERERRLHGQRSAHDQTLVWHSHGAHRADSLFSANGGCQKSIRSPFSPLHGPPDCTLAPTSQDRASGVWVL